MMTTLLKELQAREERGLIRSQTDGRDLVIYNYTHECQFSKQWDQYTLMARGLILNKEGQIVARPFDKFFNLDEGVLLYEDPVPLEELVAKYGTPMIEDKLDGSLGIVFWYYNQWNIATRGSFESDQAIHAQKFLSHFTEDLNKNATHLFEIVYPENRIVIDYHGKDTLYYLWSRENDSGKYYKDENIAKVFPRVDQFDEINNRANAEGYVLFFPDAPNNGLRVKIKFEEYVRLHRIMTGLTPKRIWDALRNGDTIDLTGVPEEFRKDVELYVDHLDREYTKYVDAVELTFTLTSSDLSRKEKALFWDRVPHLRPMLFARLDGRPYDQLIWKKIEPSGDSLDLDDRYIPERGD